MNETFREWLEHEHGEKDKFIRVSRVIEEFDQRFNKIFDSPGRDGHRWLSWTEQAVDEEESISE